MLTALAVTGLVVALLAARSAEANPEQVAEILRKSGEVGLAQNVGLPDDKKERAKELARALREKTGGRVYVVLLKKDTDIEPYAALYAKLGLGGKDVLVLSNGSDWDLRCAAIDRSRKNAVMDAALRGSAGRPGLERLEALFGSVPAAIAGAQAASRGQPGATSSAAASSGTSGWVWVGLVALLVLIAGGVAVVLRRRARDRDRQGDFARAVAPAETAITEFYLGLDGVENHPRFPALIERANRVEAEIKQIKAGPPDRQAVARAESLAGEAQRLRSDLAAMKG